jgi:hypothetical protein
MDMMRVIKAIRFANTVSNMRGEKDKALNIFSKVTQKLEEAHETSDVARHIINKEVCREDLHYVMRTGRRYGPGLANRVYARYMEQRALEAAVLEEEIDEPEA